MYTIKAFMNYPALVSNAEGVVARFGELSTQNLTYTRFRGEYANVSAYPNSRLITYHAVDESNVRFELPQTPKDRALELGEWLYQQYDQGLIPANSNKAALVAAITAQFSWISSVQIGQILTDGTKRMPDYIRFNTGFNGESYRFTVWFAAQEFAMQYDEYSIVAIPPVTPVDELVDTTVAVAAKVASRPVSDLLTQISIAESGAPSTTQQTLDLIWHNPTNPAETLVTPWVMVVYGPAGIDVAAFKTAVRDYLAANSNRTDWNIIYPDLYSEQEFAIVPFWDNEAVPTNPTAEGLYSSILDYGTAKAYVAARVPTGYAQAAVLSSYLDNNLQLVSTTYRAMQFAAVGNPNNTNAVFKLRSVVGDYTSVPTTSTDFARMVPQTREWVTKLLACLNQAFRHSINDPIPSGYGRTISGSRVYLSFEHAGYTYRVLTRLSANQL